MIPEFGQLALILALMFAITLASVPLAGTYSGNRQWMSLARPLSWGMFSFLMFALVCLAISFVRDDFSVEYVAQNSNSMLPVQYKISAVWGGHEGSLLLWVVILGGWSYAVSIFSKGLSREMMARVLSVMGMISVGFLLFMLLTSNPFDRLLPNFPADGNDLNPLLQDIGLILHPPLLYMGYVGFSVAFAFAIAALLGGHLDAAWARWSRPWTNVAWAFLTIGIALGSWWAYYELGWGGWWFWDPVENASFMPWLVGTALMHSLAVTEKRGVFKSWTVLLAIFAFSLSLLGTFLVRSGVLTSVHAFATDPARGAFILMFLLFVVGGSLTLYAFKAPEVKSKITFNWSAREAFLLINNILLTVSAAMVLLGTLFPLLLDAMGGGKISVGPPYFNALFSPLVALMAATLGVGMVSRWKETSSGYLWQQLKRSLVLSVVLGVAFSVLYGDNFYFSVLLAMTLVFWVVLVTLQDMLNRTRNKSGIWARVRSLKPVYWGMVLGHLGLAAAILGAVLTSYYTIERDLRMEPGDTITLHDYSFKFVGARHLVGPNYEGDEGVFEVYRDGELYTQMTPEKRIYNVSQMPMTEAAIDAGLNRDLYLAMGEPLGDGAWAVRVQYKAFVRWIWLGGLLMTFGGLLAACDRRYRMRERVAQRDLATPASSAVA
ncbi:heme lyase CcmF/NrfE family subunit [Aestuariirhabdus sp. Z084]|uniref:heme lyase CcmF/NrfE family subunit n=1 Tax=Aestuariirhabdus haliotis TaxID=2918751 RepID=UPI00201B3DDB|nr:heme lyase CcmF/NrfE family subunit [Aestuariirhabdus haliotis]MCL6415546.1 heme lyase CcmF/NrfE family subunit [Aestuariirhabdus haliotis]MCL6419249.1 heme lyase CcmF/NrfE family subunit [Aestuariirhabdus haliotis]